MPLEITTECVTKVLSTLALLTCLTPGTPSAQAALAFQPLERRLPRHLRPATAATRCDGEQLTALVARWRRALGLLDWRIVPICGMWISKMETHDGITLLDADERQALVFLHPEPLRSIESIVVHELLHIKVAEIRSLPENEEDAAEEELVEQLEFRMFRPVAQ